MFGDKFPGSHGQSASGCGDGRTFIETDTPTLWGSLVSLPPLITGPVTGTVFGAFAATEREFIQLFFIGFFSTSTMSTLAETARSHTVYRAFVFLAPLFSNEF
jgi:hypothetical protein